MNGAAGRGGITRLVTTTVIVVATPALTLAQTVTGSVMDAATLLPVGGALVTLVGSTDAAAGRVTTTGPDGRYSLRAERPGAYRLRVVAPGYRPLVLEPVELQAAAPLERVIELTPLAPIRMDTVIVEGEKRAVPWYLADFYDRRQRARGLGSFLSPEDIKGLAPMNPSDLVRRLSGFTLARDQVIQNLRNPSGCPPLVFIDGLPAPFVKTADDLNTLVWMDVLAAVEAYHSPARIPPQFNMTGASCGVLIFWTKR